MSWGLCSGHVSLWTPLWLSGLLVTRKPWHLLPLWGVPGTSPLLHFDVRPLALRSNGRCLGRLGDIFLLCFSSSPPSLHILCGDQAPGGGAAFYYRPTPSSHAPQQSSSHRGLLSGGLISLLGPRKVWEPLQMPG